MAPRYNLEAIPQGSRPTMLMYLQNPDLRDKLPTMSSYEVKEKLRKLDRLTYDELCLLSWFHVLAHENEEPDVIYVKGVRICRAFFNAYLLGEVLTVILLVGDAGSLFVLTSYRPLLMAITTTHHWLAMSPIAIP